MAIKIPDAERTLWEEIPDPAVYTLARVSKVSLAGHIVLTTWATGIAAMTSAHAVAVGATTAVVATQAHGFSTMAGIGSTQATTTTTATTAKGSATAGKAGGVSAKLAAASHGALPKAALLAGKGIAIINPVTAVGGIALTGYFHHKYKKHKAFKHRLQAHDQDAGDGQPFSIETMLEREDKLFEEAEKEGEEVDVQFEDELYEELDCSFSSGSDVRI